MKRVFTLFGALALVGILAGSAMAQRGQGGGDRGQGGGMQRGGMMGGMQGGLMQGNQMMLLQREDVQKDLQLTAEQKTRLQAANEKMTGQMRDAMQGMRGGGGDRTAIQETMQRLQTASEREVNAILTPAQQKRLLEIQIQLSGPRALLLPAVQKVMELTDDQMAKIRDLQQQHQQANAAAMRNAAGNREAMQASREKNDAVLAAEIDKVLTAPQRAKLKELTGRPFVADAAPAGQRGGGGGRGGGRTGGGIGG
jgi:hypothetical protein